MIVLSPSDGVRDVRLARLRTMVWCVRQRGRVRIGACGAEQAEPPAEAYRDDTAANMMD